MKYRKQRVIVIFLAIIQPIQNEIDSKAKQETTSILSKFDWIHRISIEKNATIEIQIQNNNSKKIYFQGFYYFMFNNRAYLKLKKNDYLLTIN